jgi:hypothetical protein
MSRKTVEIDYLKKFANQVLSGSHPDSVRERRGVIIMIEDVLMKADCYKGFKYLKSDDLTDDTVREYL